MVLVPVIKTETCLFFSPFNGHAEFFLEQKQNLHHIFKTLDIDIGKS